MSIFPLDMDVGIWAIVSDTVRIFITTLDYRLLGEVSNLRGQSEQIQPNMGIARIILAFNL